MKHEVPDRDDWMLIEDGIEGFSLRSKDGLRLIASWGMGWDHVSVSRSNRCPTWDEMCRVKNLLFDPEELAIQYHPPKSKYKNQHKYCLHLWRPQNETVPMPPLITV